MRLVLVGAPGSGKGTQAELLVKRLGLTYVGTGAILRDAIARKTPTGCLVKPLMDQGLLVADGIVNEVVAELLQRKDRPERFVLDGYPRTRAQAVAFDELQRKIDLPLTGVVSFAIADDEVVRRISSRRVCADKSCLASYNLAFRRPKVDGTCDKCGGHLLIRDDDKEETVRRRLQEFHKNTDALIEHYRRNGLLREVDATQPVEAIYQSVLTSLNVPTSNLT
jgi:adenylate kinase